MSSRMIPETTPTVISKNNLIHWLDQIASQMRMIAPRDIAGNILYRQVGNAC